MKWQKNQMALDFNVNMIELMQFMQILYDFF